MYVLGLSSTDVDQILNGFNIYAVVLEVALSSLSTILRICLAWLGLRGDENLLSFLVDDLCRSKRCVLCCVLYCTYRTTQVRISFDTYVMRVLMNQRDILLARYTVSYYELRTFQYDVQNETFICGTIVFAFQVICCVIVYTVTSPGDFLFLADTGWTIVFKID